MKKSIWILLDNRIGSRHQAEGIANYLNPTQFEITFKEIEYTKLGALPNILRGNTLLGITKSSKNNLYSPYPDIVLSATRRTAPIARWIKKQHPSTKLIQLLHIGRIGLKDFTVVFAPEHDKYKNKAPNIQYTLGSPHFITQEKLQAARTKWNDTFKSLPHPMTALIIGGSIKKHPFLLENAQELGQLVKKMKEQDGGSILITTSRRTGEQAQQCIMDNLRSIPHYAYLWGDKGDNPYTGFLACADNLIVTGDSVSMCCEATAAHKPLAIFTGKNWLTKKHLRFVHSLYDKQYAQELNEKTIFTEVSQHPLNIAQEIANYISTL